MPTTPQKSKALYYDIDLKKNQILNAKLHPLTTAERTTLGASLGTADKGISVYDTTLKTLFSWDGTAWGYVSLNPSQIAQLEEAFSQVVRSLTVTKTSVTSKTITLTTEDATIISGTFEDAYVFVQNILATQWTINHNLNKFPSVHVVDTSNNEVVAELQYTTVNQVVLKFSEPFSGSAYLS